MRIEDLIYFEYRHRVCKREFLEDFAVFLYILSAFYLDVFSHAIYFILDDTSQMIAFFDPG